MKKSKSNKQSKKVKKPKLARKMPAGNKIGFTPVGDNVLIKPIVPETTTSFGLVLPDNGKEKPEQGVVAAVGPGRKNDKGERVTLDVKVGDKVFFKKPWNEPLTIEGTEYYVISESEITLIQK